MSRLLPCRGPLNPQGWSALLPPAELQACSQTSLLIVTGTYCCDNIIKSYITDEIGMKKKKEIVAIKKLNVLERLHEVSL